MSALITLEPGAVAPGPPAVVHRGAKVLRREDGGRPVVVKVATGNGRADLRREALLLDAAAGPEVVRILRVVESDDATEVVLAGTGGPSLAAVLADPAVDACTAVRTVADACDAVARLHARGWAHGRLRPDHVLTTGRGRIRLCSFGGATRLGTDDEAARRDRTALLRIVDRWTERGPDGASRWRRLRRRSVVRRVRRRTVRLIDDPDPVVLARILRRAVGRGPRSRRRLVVAATLAIAASIPFLVRHDPAGPAPRQAVPLHTATTGAPTTSATTTAVPTTTAAPTTPAPTTTSLDRPDSTAHGPDVTIDGRTYRVGLPGDVVAVGDWDCDGTTAALLLRPATSELYEFMTWAVPGAPATARPAGLVPGARDLEPPVGCGDATIVLADGGRRRAGIAP